MYRPPEMCDLYLGYEVNEKVDIWMLGKLLKANAYYFFFLYRSHKQKTEMRKNRK